MRIRITDPTLGSDLLRFLRERVDVIAAEACPGEILVSVLGSRRMKEHDAELVERLRVWQEGHPHVSADAIPDELLVPAPLAE